MGLDSGDKIKIASQYGSVEAFVAPDKDLRRGVVSISHSWGGLPDGRGPGVNINLLTSTDSDVQNINAMPRMSAVPVTVTKINATAGREPGTTAGVNV